MKRIFSYDSFLNESRLTDMYDERKELILQIADMRKDMENDPEVIEQPDASAPGSKADWYGGELGKLDAELEKLEAKIAKAEDRKNPKELTYEEAVHMDTIKTMNKNIEDIKKSRASWPDRSMEQEAEIYKKRYGINGDIEGIIYALKKLQDEKKI